MALTKEIVQRVQSLYSKGVQSDDSRLKPRHIYNKLTTVRSKLITQEINKRQKSNQWNYQTLPCVEMIKASPSECECLPTVGCQILRSKNKLPKPLSSIDKHLIQNVSSLEGSVIYSEITFQEAKYKHASKFTANKPDYWVRNGYLFLTHRTGPKVVVVTGLFEDPFEAENFVNYCVAQEDCNDCNDCGSPMDMEFPLDSDKVDTLIEMSVNELVILFSQSTEDIKNDSRDIKEN